MKKYNKLKYLGTYLILKGYSQARIKRGPGGPWPPGLLEIGAHQEN